MLLLAGDASGCRPKAM